MPEFLLHFYLYYCIAVQYSAVCAVHCTVGHHLQHCTAGGSRPCVLSVATLHTLSPEWAVIVTDILPCKCSTMTTKWPMIFKPTKWVHEGSKVLIQSDDDSVWSDLCTWLWESGLKLMEVPWAEFFSNLGGNELSNTTSALMAAAGIVRGYLNYVLLIQLIL